MPDPEAEPAEIDIYLVHNRVDKDWVRKLGGRLEAERHNGRYLRAFFDEWDIRPGQNVVIRINDGLKQARFVGVVLSPEMLEAPWPTLEWTTAVYSDPAGLEGRVLPILFRNCDVPPVLTVLNWLDFRDPANFEREFRRLLTVLRGEPVPRGVVRPGFAVEAGTVTVPPEPVPGATADVTDEEVLSNLFPVGALPTEIWEGSTWARTPADLFDRAPGLKLAPFVLKEGRIFTFEPLSGQRSVLSKVGETKNFARHDPLYWLGEAKYRPWLIELLNRSVSRHLRSMGMLYDKRSRKFFFPAEEGRPKTLGWRPSKRLAWRQVAWPYRRSDGTVAFWIHLAITAEFIPIGESLLLKVWPGWIYTKDGIELVEASRRGPLTTRRTSKEGNERVLSNLRVWTTLLSAGKRNMQIPTGGKPIVISMRPWSAMVDHGIVGDKVDFRSMTGTLETIDFDIVVEEEGLPLDFLTPGEEEKEDEEDEEGGDRVA